MADKIFADGIYLNKVNDNAPVFIKANVSIHIEKAIAWLEAMKANANDKGYITLVGKESQQGKRYFELDTWKPTKTEAQAAPAPSNEGMTAIEYPEEEINPDDIPF